MGVNPAMLALSAAKPGLLPLAFIGGGSGVSLGRQRVFTALDTLTGWRKVLLVTGLCMIVPLVFVLLAAVMVCCTLLASYVLAHWQFGWECAILIATLGLVAFMGLIWGILYLIMEW